MGSFEELFEEFMARIFIGTLMGLYYMYTFFIKIWLAILGRDVEED